MKLLTKTERYALRDAVRAEMDRRRLDKKEVSVLSGVPLSRVMAATAPHGQATGRLVDIARALDIQTERSAV